MGKIILKEAVKRKAGFLYYVDAEGNVCESEMSKGRKNSKKENLK